MPLSDHQLLDHLVTLTQKLGIEVRSETLEDSPGGLYSLKGQRHLVLNQDLPVDRRVDVVVNALKKEDLSGQFVIPALREILDHQS